MADRRMDVSVSNNTSIASGKLANYGLRRHSLLLGAVMVAALAASTGALARESGTGSRVVNIDVTKDPNYSWGELQIAINPKNPDNIVYATVGTGMTVECIASGPMCQYVPSDLGIGRPFPQPRGHFEGEDFNVVVPFVSMDGGKSWRRTRLPDSPEGLPDLDEKGDPSVTVTPDGTFYVSWDAMNWGTPQKALPSAGIGVSKSTDGGLTWSPVHLSGTPADGPKIAADRTTGRVYAASSTFLGPRSTGKDDAPQGRVNDRWIAATTDGVTWTSPKGMGGMGGTHVAAHGVLATAFSTTGSSNMFGSANNQLCGDKPAPCAIFQTSVDDGATWTRHFLPKEAGNSPMSGPMSGPVVAVNPARKGHYAVSVAMNNSGEYHIYQSRDAGVTWTGPAVITEDTSKRHYFAAMDFSQDGKTLGIMWRTRQSQAAEPARPQMGPEAQGAFNVWAAISRDGGATFSKALKISTADSPAPPGPPQANSGDDYSGIALAGKNVYVGWADWRSGNRAGYIGIAPLKAFKFGK